MTTPPSAGPRPGLSRDRAAGERSVSATEAALWVVALLAMVADLLSTAFGLGLGLGERNPIARAVIDVAGMAGLVWVKLFVLALAVACRSVTPDRAGAALPVAVGVPWGVAAGLNAMTILAAT